MNYIQFVSISILTLTWLGKTSIISLSPDNFTRHRKSFSFERVNQHSLILWTTNVIFLFLISSPLNYIVKWNSRIDVMIQFLFLFLKFLLFFFYFNKYSWSRYRPYIKCSFLIQTHSDNLFHIEPRWQSLASNQGLWEHL